MTLGDIYYVLFRHKWKILLCTLTGLLAAVGVYKFFPQPYQSEAKLFIRYVTEGKTLAAPGMTRRSNHRIRGEKPSSIRKCRS